MPMHDDPVLQTARLTLRLPRRGDFDRYAELMADEAACRYIGGHMARGAAWRKFLQMPGAWAIQGFAMFSVVETASGRWLGQAGPWQPDGWPGTEVGYVFHPDAWGRGFATEAVTACIDYAFGTLGWDEVIHCIHPDNAGSQGVARAVGSRLLREARLPAPADVDVPVWGQSRADWQARRAAG